MSTIVCPKCGESNADTQRFCGACGMSLFVTCSSCGEANPPGFRFCGSCGAALTTVAKEQVTASEERRWATVLFGDLSGFTKLSEGLDPEDVRSLVDRSMSGLGKIAETYEGRVERVTGDEIMVVFGAPRAHEDDPERAVRTALEMQRFASDHVSEFRGLPLRIGVNTGEMMFGAVGPEGARHHTVMGDAVNTASRLQTAAPLGGVLVGKETYEATKHAIRYEEIAPIRAKGKQEPVAAWVALETLTEPATRVMSEVPLVGRSEEIELLDRIWRRVTSENRAQLVTIVGHPGIGKSKLAREFTAGLGERAYWGRSLPYSERVGGAFGNIVRVLSDVYVTDEPEVARAKIAVTIANLVGEPDVELADHLAMMIGQGAEAEVDRNTLFASARRFVEALAAERPIVLVFEDLHWADPSLLELIQWLVNRLGDSAVLFLTLTRPELLDAQPSWGGGISGYTSLPLGPLGPTESRELAQQLRTDMDEALLDRIESSAGGNPLFVEELTAWLADERSEDGAPIPTTVTSIVSARLDALPQRLRKVLLDASVVGPTFWRGSLEAITGEIVRDALDDLVARDLIRRNATSRVPNDEEFAFRHQLIHDIAYAILPKALRRERHQAIARHIEGRVSSPEIVAGILARHWREAGDNERAISYLLAAADVAGRGWEQTEALDLLKQALELVSPDEKDQRRRVMLKLAVARQIWTHSILDADTIRAHAEGLVEPHEH